MPRQRPAGKHEQPANCTLPRMPRRRRPSSTDSMHNVEAALSHPLPAIESDQTRDVLHDYLTEIKALADAVVPGNLRVALRRHIIALQRRLDEYDAQNGSQ